MIKIYKIFLLTILFANVAKAQSTFPPDDGNVGIGTLSPDSKLNVIGEIHITDMIGSKGCYFNVLKIGGTGLFSWILLYRYQYSCN